MIKKIIFSLIAIMLLSFSYTSNFRDLVIEKLSAYNDNAPEKIYVQTDKPYYTLGDDVWFSAYLVNGISHKPSLKSNVIYVELINENDSIVDKKQLLVEDLSTAGDFKLKPNWKPGQYTIRAYSSFMRNFSSDYFFKTKIPVITNQDNIVVQPQDNKGNAVSTVSNTKDIPDIGFYPESGYLINNIPSKVAIKIKGKHKNTVIEGVIKNSNGKEITTFKTYKFGLSIIKLTPEANKNYYASVIFNNKEVKYPLPKALPEGYSLEISNTGNNINVKVSSSASKSLINTYLVAHQRGKLVYENFQTSDTTSYKIKMDTKFLSDGVITFTLFNNAGEPVCERLVFSQNSINKVDVNLSLNKEVYSARDKVTLQASLTDHNQNPTLGNFSISITDIDAVEQNTSNENIKTYLLLNSDLRGQIENPGYFFQKENDYKRRFLLDLIMLTNGWRRFKWKELLYTPKLKKIPFVTEKGIYISGHTTALKGSKRQISAKTRISFIGDLENQEEQQSNKAGKFIYGPYIFKDTLNSILEARVKDFKSDNIKTNRDVEIRLDNQLKDSPKVDKTNLNSIAYPTIIDSNRIKNYIKKTQQRLNIESEFSKKNTVLDEVLIIAKNEAAQDKRRKELNDRTLYGAPTGRLDLNEREEDRIYNVIDLINQLPSVRAFDDFISIRNQGQATILLDGRTVSIQDITILTGEDIDFIDVLFGANAALIPNASNGAIAIYTRIGSFSSSKNVKRKPGIVNFTLNGFYTAREFYAPNYNDDFEALKAYKDLRTTLHWEPKIRLMPSAPKANISFFTGDVKSNYAIKIEGITNDGLPFYHLSTFEVN